MTPLPQQRLYIDGEYVASLGDERFDSINPANGQALATCHQAVAGDIDAAVDSARKGFESWSQMTAIDRSRILLNVVSVLRERNDELAELEVMDTGKPIREASTGDIVTGADVIEYYAGLIPTLQGSHQTLDASHFFYTRREPVGVCAGIGAWNYPIQIACWKSAIALARGNAMVYKPSEITPLSSFKLAEIYTEAGVPNGVFNVVSGGGSTGQLLVENPGIDKVSFTGSTATGQKILSGAAQGIKDVTLELGGKSPLIIFADCKNHMQHAREEIFGPVMSVFRFSDEDEVVALANDTEFGLAAGIFTQNFARAHRVIAQLQAGICWINSYGDSPAEMPVGGYKHSGIGRENGIDSIRHYTQLKSVYVSLDELENPFA